MLMKYKTILKISLNQRKKYIYSAISLCILVAIIFFYQYSSHQDTYKNPIHKIVTHKTDTIYIVDTVRRKQNKTNIGIDKYAPLKRYKTTCGE